MVVQDMGNAVGLGLALEVDASCTYRVYAVFNGDEEGRTYQRAVCRGAAGRALALVGTPVFKGQGRKWCTLLAVETIGRTTVGPRGGRQI